VINGKEGQGFSNIPNVSLCFTSLNLLSVQQKANINESTAVKV
jgi:hypothetical protein